MKLFAVSAALCLVGATHAIHEQVIKAKWASFKAKHGKDYHPSEEAVRMRTFLETTLHIEEHNARFHRGEVSYELGHNHLSDIPHHEVKAKMLGKKSINLEGRNITELPPLAMPFMPARVDWRDKSSDIVTPAKDQSSCGSCYSFGTVGVIEAALIKKFGKNKFGKTGKEQIPDLSEQQIVDCSFYFEGEMNGGCDGGHELVVMDYVSKYGLTDESAYPYRSGTSQTHHNCMGRYGKLGVGLTYSEIKPRNELKLAEAVAQYGPLVISISGENRDFQMFRGGIYDNRRCTQQVDHVISLVGYGSENGRDYWIVKNSWGKTWGENGFGKVLRGVNQCGIVSDSSWAVHV